MLEESLMSYQEQELQVRLRRVFCALLGSVLLLGGCASTTNVQQIDRLDSVGENPRIILMPPDIRYYLLTAGGLPEPNAEWTNAAMENFAMAVENFADQIGSDLRIIDKTNLTEEEIRYDTLHSAVGITLLNNYFGMAKLPSKGERFDWSLGPGVSSIGAAHNADYALFAYYRDYQASGGRIAFAVLAAAAVGAAVPAGAEFGFASLVDLKTGNIVWFNKVDAGVGELRDPDGAAKVVDTLFRDIPTRAGLGTMQ
jgi:hypothetical protein